MVENDLDEWMSEDDILTQDYSASQARAAEFIDDAFAFHYTNNERYRRYSDAVGSAPRRGGSPRTVPLLPVTLFKRPDALIATPTSEDAIVTTSSGTRGSISRVNRDNTTLMRYFASVAVVCQNVLGVQNSETKWHILGPTTADVNDLWMAYVLSGASLAFDHTHHLVDGELRTAELIESFSHQTEFPSAVIGPPHRIMEVARVLRREGLSPRGIRCVVTVGGWKSHDAVAIKRREFIDDVTATFNLEDSSCVRDSYNMVELNTVLIECAMHRMHCPPWLYAGVREPRTLVEVKDGGGILAFADPTPTSFPGFILSEDFGAVHRKVHCECGITGDVLEFDRRVNRVEQRGCALRT